jgi:hypothetical protein
MFASVLACADTPVESVTPFIAAAASFAVEPAAILTVAVSRPEIVYVAADTPVIVVADADA